MTDTSQAAGAPLPINSTSAPVTQTMASTPTATGQVQGSGLSNTGKSALTFDQVENYWIQAGGSPQSAAMAAAIADAESGLNPNATRTNPDGTIGVGLWLTPQNGTPPGSTDPLASARGALQLSNNGTDWTQWCSTWSDNNCGCSGGTYLGSGANALMSLGTQSEPGSYNMIGSVPSSSGQGASGATSSSAGVGAPSATKSSSFGILIVLLLIAVGVYFYMRSRGGSDGGGGEGEAPQPTGGGGGGTIHVPAHTRQAPGG